MNNQNQPALRILVLNGPNLNLLGRREPEIYGTRTYSDLIGTVTDHAAAKGCEIEVFQTNCEGTYIDRIQGAVDNFDALILNPAGYTHTSVAIADAVAAVGLPAVEVHLSDPDTREEFRHVSYVRPHCIATVKGLGFESYLKAIDLLLNRFVK